MCGIFKPEEAKLSLTGTFLVCIFVSWKGDSQEMKIYVFLSCPAPRSVKIWINLDPAINWPYAHLHRIPLAWTIDVTVLSRPQASSLLSFPTTALLNSCIPSARHFSLNLELKVPSHLHYTVHAIFGPGVSFSWAAHGTRQLFYRYLKKTALSFLHLCYSIYVYRGCRYRAACFHISPTLFWVQSRDAKYLPFNVCWMN